MKVSTATTRKAHRRTLKDASAATGFTHFPLGLRLPTLETDVRCSQLDYRSRHLKTLPDRFKFKP